MILYLVLDSIITRNAENKTFTLYSSYSGIKYKFYIAGGINNITSGANGGVKDILFWGQVIREILK